MNAASATAAQPADRVTKFTTLAYYKYHFVSFMKERDKLDEYNRQLKAIARREAASQSLLSLLDKESAKYLADDFRFERECVESNIADTEQYLKRKCEELLEAVAWMQKIGLPVEESVIAEAKAYINA